MQASFAAACTDLRAALAAWQTASSTGLAALNAVLAQNNRPAIAAPAGTVAAPVCGP
jgi:hypothetical protein